MSEVQEFRDEGARACSVELGGSKRAGRDWIAIEDVGIEIVFRRVGKEKWKQWDEVREADDMRIAWFLSHVAYPKPEIVRELIEERPLLELRVQLAIMSLYGNVTKFELGKVGS